MPPPKGGIRSLTTPTPAKPSTSCRPPASRPIAARHRPHDRTAGKRTGRDRASYGSGLLVNHGGPVISDAGFWALHQEQQRRERHPNLDQSIDGDSEHPLAVWRRCDAFVTSFGISAPYSQAPTDDFPIVQQYGPSISSTVTNWGYYVASERTKANIQILPSADFHCRAVRTAVT